MTPDRRSEGRLAAWCAAILLVVGGVSLAAETPPGDDDQGLVLQVDYWALSPRNADTDYAFEGVGALASGGRIRSVSPDQSPAIVMRAEWRLATARPTRLGVCFWEYDDRFQSTTGEQTQDIGAILASPTLLASFNFFGFSPVDSASASSRIRAVSMDAGAAWEHELGGGGVLRFEAGARLFRLERELHVVYFEDSGGEKTLFINESMDAKGIGPRAAVAYDHAFRRIRLGGLFGMALPIGEHDAFSRQEFFLDSGAGSSLDIATEWVQPETTRATLQLEAEFRFRVVIHGGWSATATYGFQHWSAVARSQRFVAGGTATAVPIEEDLIFEGLALGIRYEF